MSSIIKIVLLEDEPHARHMLKNLIAAESDLKIVGECADGLQALEAIRSERPDLVFLDIQTPGLNGIDVVKSLKHSEIPFVIVTTAYANHALWAFDINAIDYLLKPYTKMRFRLALSRARAALHVKNKISGNTNLITERTNASLSNVVKRHGVDILKMKVGTKIKFISISKICYMRAQSYHIVVSTMDEQFSVRERMKNLERQFGDDSFMRIHRSVLVNTNYISDVSPWLHGDYRFTMRDGTVFHSSGSYRARVRAMLHLHEIP